MSDEKVEVLVEVVLPVLCKITYQLDDNGEYEAESIRLASGGWIQSVDPDFESVKPEEWAAAEEELRKELKKRAAKADR